MANKNAEYGLHADKNSGKFARKVKRNKIRALKESSKKGQHQFFGKVSPRQERKRRSKTLKVPFKKIYNAPLYKVTRELITNEKGYQKIAIKEIKEIRV